MCLVGRNSGVYGVFSDYKDCTQFDYCRQCSGRSHSAHRGGPHHVEGETNKYFLKCPKTSLVISNLKISGVTQNLLGVKLYDGTKRCTNLLCKTVGYNIKLSNFVHKTE